MNLADVVRKRANNVEQLKSDYVKNEMSTFLKQINKKLSLVNLKLEDFKVEGEYNFNDKTANKLIELFEFNLKQIINKFEKNNIESADRQVIAGYLSLVEELCASHFSSTEMEQIQEKLSAIQVDLNIYEKSVLKNVAMELFKEASTSVNVTAIHEIEKLFVDIYSINKYPYLTEDDRVSLFTDLEGKLALLIEEHQEAIERVNYYRSTNDNQDEDINWILDL